MTRNQSKEFLARARRSRNAVGELVGLMLNDPNIPSLFNNQQAMLDYVVRHGWPTDAVPLLWRRYRDWHDRHPWGMPL